MKFKPTLSEWGLFKDIIGWNFLSQVFNAINWNLQRFLIPRFVDTKSFGLYSIYDDFVGMAYHTVLVPISSPVSVSLQHAKNENKLTQKYNAMLNAIFTVVAPIYGFIACFPEQTILFFFGEKWLENSYILQYLAIFAIIGIPSTLIGSLANILYQNKSLTLRAFIELMVNLLVTFFAVKHYGINGALLARLVSSIFIAVFSINMAKRFVSSGFKSHFLAIYRPVIALILAQVSFLVFIPKTNSILGNLNNFLTVLVLGFIYLFIYSSVVTFLWIIFAKKDGIENAIFEKYLRKYFS